MIRSMEEEFRDIVGIRYYVTCNKLISMMNLSSLFLSLEALVNFWIAFTLLTLLYYLGCFCSVPLWIYTICCTILDFHGNFLLVPKF